MKTIWNVETRLMNGTVTMETMTDAFLDKELAEKVAEAVRKANIGSQFPVHVRVTESKLYENKIEIPILNDKL